MPTLGGVKVWLQDSMHCKLDPQVPQTNQFNNGINSDDRIVTVQTEMLRDESYTVHCLSPISVLCDVFVITPSGIRKDAARFYLDKTPATSEHVSGSSANYTLAQFKHQGLRTPKRRFQQGKLGSVEVEIRRINEIFKLDFVMIDDPDQPPWLVFRFDIKTKESPAAPLSTGGVRMHEPHQMTAGHSQPIAGSQARTFTSNTGNETHRETDFKRFSNSKKRPREDDNPSGVDENPIGINLDLLHQEYKEEEAEEQRLVRKLQERVQTKKARNMALRELLGEIE